jgi:biopolymer transport protein ExbB
MFEFFQAGGWLMIPILLSSIIAMAIIMERGLSLRSIRVVPRSAIKLARALAKMQNIPNEELAKLRQHSLVGKVLVNVLDNHQQPRYMIRENVEEAGRHAVHEMERYMTTLGTISTITPLMGLLGTVLGMIQVFAVITDVGIGNPTDLAGGISQALITTAAGISVAIITLIFHRYFKAKIDDHITVMEKESLSLIEIVNEVNQRKAKSATVQALKQQKINADQTGQST